MVSQSSVMTTLEPPIRVTSRTVARGAACAGPVTSSQIGAGCARPGAAEGAIVQLRSAASTQNAAAPLKKST